MLRVEGRTGETPTTELLRQKERYYPLVTARAAQGTLAFILDLHRNHQGELSKEIIKDWKPRIDGVSKQIMQDELNDIPFETISVGSEGPKEILYAGEAAPSLQGSYGETRYGYPKVWKVSDVVEGTDWAVRNEPGATSTLAITPPEGIMPTPENATHMVKLIAPPQAKGLMSLDQDHEANLRNLIAALKIKPEKLTQVTLNPYKNGVLTREINLPFIEAAKKVGVNLVIIEAGDFIPGIRASLDPNKSGFSPLIVATRSGWEETTMDAAAANALGGFMEARRYDNNPQIMANNPLWTLKNLCPAPKDSVLVSASFITDDNNWFMKPGVKRMSEKSETVTTLIVTHSGIKFIKTELPLESSL